MVGVIKATPTPRTSPSSTPPSATYRSQSVSCLLGVACGDILGSQCEGHHPDKIAVDFPYGIEDFRSGPAYYTDDTQMTIALAASIIEQGRCDAKAAAEWYAKEFEPWRGYGKTAKAILQDLRAGADYRTSGARYFPEGSWANGGAMRIAPVGLAYRHASPGVLYDTVSDALICTHTHAVGVDGAYVQALAVGFLATRVEMQGSGDAARPVSVPSLELLDYLIGLARTEEVRDKLGAVRDLLRDAPPPLASTSGPRPVLDILESDRWSYVLQGQMQMSKDYFQIRASDAVASALLAFVHFPDSPHDFIRAAVHLGGDTDTIGALCGAYSVAWGPSWVPAAWRGRIEEGERIEGLGAALAAIDVHVGSSGGGTGASVSEEQVP